MELENFFKNVMPVADYFDQSDLLIAVGYSSHVLSLYQTTFSSDRSMEKDLRQMSSKIFGKLLLIS